MPFIFSSSKMAMRQRFFNIRKRSDLTPPELRPIELEGDGGRASPNTSQKRQVLITNLREWFANTPIHGARYFMSRKLHWSERIWWLIAYSISLYVCGSQIRGLWLVWNANPIAISLSGKTTGVETVTFPAVTICPRTRTVKNKLNFNEAWHSLKEYLLSEGKKTNSLSDEEFHRLKAILLTCDESNVMNLPFEILDELYENETIYKTIRELAPKTIFSNSKCSWLGDEKPCPHYLRASLTEQGLCYSFNVLNSNEIYTNETAPEIMIIDNNPKAIYWHPENGYDESHANGNEKLYPHRSHGIGLRAGFRTTLLILNYTTDFLCSGPILGFKVMIHRPDEIPQISKNFFHVPAKTDILITVKPNLFTTDKHLIKYSPNQRQCFFDTEQNLRFFKHYNQRNCELECLANFTKLECGCVPFYMPRDRTTKICGLGSVACSNAADDNSFKLNALKKCNCLPSCKSTSYGVEISQANINRISSELISQLSIMFREREFISSTRTELYSQTDFIANCGGLLSLFTGVSLLSIVEMVYYCTLRLGCSLCIQRAKFKQRNANMATPSNTVVVSIEEFEHNGVQNRY